VRDGTVGGGSGHGAVPNPGGGPGWDQGLFRGDGAYGPPAHEAPGYQAPGYGPPGRQGPDYQGPGYRTPDYQEPPAYEAPVHGIPEQRTAGGEPGQPPEPEPGGHRAGGGHRRGGARKKPRSRGRRVLKWTSISVAVIVLGTAGAAYGYYEYLSSKIRKGERQSGVSTVAKPKANANGDTPMNILILGSDTRNSADDRKLGGAADSGGARADVIMLAHLSADRSNMSVVSIPRDTRVDIPPCTDPKTKQSFAAVNTIINASLGRGGPGCTLATVQNLTGLYIDHWLMIDFSGVVKMADVVGGVEVCVQNSVWDRPTKYIKHGGSGLKLTKGTHTLYHQQALQWLRTRDAFGSDAGRAKAQHMYMSSLIRKLRSQNLFSNPARLNKIATTAMEAFEVSSEIGTPKKLYDLGMQLKTVPPNRITMLTMPHDEDQQDKNHYVPADSAATVWSLLRNDVAMDPNGKPKTAAPASGKPATATPSGPAARPSATIPVTVVNGTAGTDTGTATAHRARDIAQALKTAGFTQATASQQGKPSRGTTVVYPSSGGAQGKADATAVAKALKIPATNVKASADVQAVTLTIGADWKTGTDFSKTLPKAGSVPDNADVMNGTEKGCMPVEPIYRWAG
jgi:LCP family protein required for cell wall assembly